MFGPSFLRVFLVLSWHIVPVIAFYAFGIVSWWAWFFLLLYFAYFYEGLSVYIEPQVRRDVLKFSRAFGVWIFAVTFIVLVDYYYFGVTLEPHNLWYMLFLLMFLLPLVFAIFLAFIPTVNENLIRFVSLLGSLLIFVLSALVGVAFTRIQQVDDLKFRMNLLEGADSFLNIQYLISVDGLSIWFILLTTLLFPIVILVSWEAIAKQTKLFYVLLFLLEFCLMNVFCAEEILIFYLFFEATAIPMFLLIGMWGSTSRRIYASFKFLFYTLFGSILMFTFLIYLYYATGTTAISALLTYKFSFTLQLLFFIAFFSSFAVKIPMIPVHLWLPEAHVEAPTGISVLLAGILLKTGGYAFIRFVLPVCPDASQFFAPLVYVISIFGIIYGSFAAIVQTDLKKMIAYSSVAHMNLATIGIFSGSLAGLQGSVYLMLTHGIVSSGLFICVGILYDRYHTRIIRYYGGLASVMPWFAFFFLLLTLANISFPSTGGFIAEFMLLADIAYKNMVVAFLAGLGIILGAIYTVWLYNRVMFGVFSPFVRYYADINFREYFILVIIIFFTFLMGVYPDFFLSLASNKLAYLNELIAVRFVSGL
jgi:NADH-quinone oxidoreductase subunit M